MVKRRAAPPTLSSDHTDVRGLQALLALLDFELDALVLLEAAKAAVVLDLAVVGKQVLAAALRRDESITLAIVEPFDDASLGAFGTHGMKFLRETVVEVKIPRQAFARHEQRHSRNVKPEKLGPLNRRGVNAHRATEKTLWKRPRVCLSA